MACVIGQVALVGQALADILGQHQARGLAIEIQLRQVHAHFEHRAILALVQAHRSVLQFTTAHLRDCTLDLVPALTRADVEDAHRQEFVAAVAVLLNGRLIDLDEAQCVRIEYPERRGVAIKEQAEAALDLAHLFAGLVALAEVGQCTDHAPLPVGHRHPLAARGNPAHCTAGQHQTKFFVEYRVAGESLVEGLLHARVVIVVHAGEEIGYRQRIGLHTEDLTRQR